MPKDPSPLLGYNNNIRHKNRVFHVQTEDSGVRHPHIITHLFMDGGRILKSVKTSYAEHLGVEKMADIVRKMMKDQHKGMLIALRDGQFDQVIDGGEAPKPVDPREAPTLYDVKKPSDQDIAAASTPPAVVRRSVPPPKGKSVPPPKRPATPPPVSAAPMTERVEESDATVAEAPPRSFQPVASDLQPPPANLFQKPRTGGYSEIPSNPPEKIGSGAPPPVRPAKPPVPGPKKPASVPPGAVVSRSSQGKSITTPGRPSPPVASIAAKPPIRRGSSPPPPKAQPPEQRGSGVAKRPAVGGAPAAAAKPASHYGQARPAAIFGQAKPRSSIFGEDIISDKSLDEVIMSYLADDTAEAKPDPKRRK
jgi:hypothetical protein